MVKPDLKLSVCSFMNGDFDVMIKDPETGQELTLSGHQKISDEDLDLVNKLAPACVWTNYKLV